MGLLLKGGASGFKNRMDQRGDSASKISWDKEFTLRQDGMVANFIFLNDFNGAEDEAIAQYYEHRFVEGMTNGKVFKTNIPVDDTDASTLPPHILEKLGKSSLRYAANIFVVSLKLDGQEVDINGKPVEVAWKDKPVEERMFIMTQGGDTADSLYMAFEASDTVVGTFSKNSKGEKIMEAQTFALKRFHNGTRVEYALMMLKSAKLSSQLWDQLMENRVSLPQFLKERREFGLRHIGVTTNNANGSAASNNSDNSQVVVESASNGIPDDVVLDDDLSDFRLTPEEVSGFDDDGGSLIG